MSLFLARLILWCVLSFCMQLIVSDPSSGESYNLDVDTDSIAGYEVGDEIDGSIVGLDGYTLEITGGSDSTGRPMREDIAGSDTKRVLLKNKTVGFKPKRGGERRRKTLRGRRIEDDIVQVNTQITEKGEKTIAELLGLEDEEEPTEE